MSRQLILFLLLCSAQWLQRLWLRHLGYVRRTCLIRSEMQGTKQEQRKTCREAALTTSTEQFCWRQRSITRGIRRGDMHMMEQVAEIT